MGVKAPRSRSNGSTHLVGLHKIVLSLHALSRQILNYLDPVNCPEVRCSTDVTDIASSLLSTYIKKVRADVWIYFWHVQYGKCVAYAVDYPINVTLWRRPRAAYHVARLACGRIFHSLVTKLSFRINAYPRHKYAIRINTHDSALSIAMETGRTQDNRKTRI